MFIFIKTKDLYKILKNPCVLEYQLLSEHLAKRGVVTGFRWRSSSYCCINSFKCTKQVLVITIFLFLLHMQNHDSGWKEPQEFSSLSNLLLQAVSGGKRCFLSPAWTSLFQVMLIVSLPPSMNHGEVKCLHRSLTDWDDHIQKVFTWNNQQLVLLLSRCTC